MKRADSQILRPSDGETHGKCADSLSAVNTVTHELFLCIARQWELKVSSVGELLLMIAGHNTTNNNMSTL